MRVGDLPDSSLVSVRMADNRRLCVATPGYLARRGTPLQPSDLLQHDCLTLSSDASQPGGWPFATPRKARTWCTCAGRPLDCSDGQVLHDWCLAGYGIAWRSTWEVEGEISSANCGGARRFRGARERNFVVFSQRKHLPLRVRLWIDHLKHHYAQPGYWQPPRAEKPPV